jgi:predicted aspartyl protease
METSKMNNPFSIISLELRHFLRAEWPELLSAIERHDWIEIKKFMCEFRDLNPSIKIDNLKSLLLCLEQHRINYIHNTQIISERFQQNFERNTISRTGLPIIGCLLNGFRIDGLIDTGAQLSIISKELVGKCHIFHLIDKRYRSKAYGIGVQQIIGKIHIIAIEIKGYRMNISLMVVETFHSNYILIGQDFLKHYKCLIDCSDNTINFRDIGLQVKCKTI